VHSFTPNHFLVYLRVTCLVVAFSEDGEDVTLQCPSIKHNIDIKEIKAEDDGQVSKLLLLKILTEQDSENGFSKTICIYLLFR